MCESQGLPQYRCEKLILGALFSWIFSCQVLVAAYPVTDARHVGHVGLEERRVARVA